MSVCSSAQYDAKTITCTPPCRPALEWQSPPGWNLIKSFFRGSSTSSQMMATLFRPVEFLSFFKEAVKFITSGCKFGHDKTSSGRLTNHHSRANYNLQSISSPNVIVKFVNQFSWGHWAKKSLFMSWPGSMMNWLYNQFLLIIFYLFFKFYACNLLNFLHGLNFI